MLRAKGDLRWAAWVLALLPVFVHCTFELIPFGIVGDVTVSENGFPLTVWWDWLPLRPDSMAYDFFLPSLLGASVLVGANVGVFDGGIQFSKFFLSAMLVALVAFVADWVVAAGFYPIYTPDPFDLRYPVSLSSLGGWIFYSDSMIYGLLLISIVGAVCGCVSYVAAVLAKVVGVGYMFVALLLARVVFGLLGMPLVLILQPYLAVEFSSCQIILPIALIFSGTLIIALVRFVKNGHSKHP